MLKKTRHVSALVFPSLLNPGAAPARCGQGCFFFLFCLSPFSVHGSLQKGAICAITDVVVRDCSSWSFTGGVGCSGRLRRSPRPAWYMGNPCWRCENYHCSCGAILATFFSTPFVLPSANCLRRLGILQWQLNPIFREPGRWRRPIPEMQAGAWKQRPDAYRTPCRTHS